MAHGGDSRPVARGQMSAGFHSNLLGRHGLEAVRGEHSEEEPEEEILHQVQAPALLARQAGEEMEGTEAGGEEEVLPARIVSLCTQAAVVAVRRDHQDRQGLRVHQGLQVRQVHREVEEVGEDVREVRALLVWQT